MRILVVTDTTGYMRGGVPAVTRQLISGLAARGHTVGISGDIPLSNDPEVAHFPISFPPNSRLPAEIGVAVERFRPDVVHVMSMSSRGVSSLIPLLANRAWFLTCHSIPPHERKLPKFHRHEAIHYGLRNVRYAPNTLAWVWLFQRGAIPHVVVHSAAVAATARAYGHSIERMTTIHLGCDITSAPKTQLDVGRKDAPFIVTTGGIAHTKGYHDAITAMAKARDVFGGIRYQIIGEVRDPSYLLYLRQLIAELNLEANVSITTDLADDQKNQALDAADLYLQPSHEEGFCLAYIEAALRVPRLVGTDTGAIRLMSKDDAGARVARVKNPEDIAASIIDLLSLQLAPSTMQSRFKRFEADFSWKQYLDAHESLYEKLIGERPRQTVLAGFE